MSQTPLCVDLDGTLIAIDTLKECLRILVREKPNVGTLLLPYLFRGRAAFKNRLAHLVELSQNSYPTVGRSLSSYRRKEHEDVD